MQRKIIKILTLMLLVSLMIPLTLNAATLSSNLKGNQMKVSEVIEVTVTTENDADNIQFDLEYDSSVYQYVLNSATSILDETSSNPYTRGVVRVSAFDRNGDTTKVVKLKFKAIAEGTSVPFKLRSLESNETPEDVTSAKLTVGKVVSTGKGGNKGKKPGLPDTGVTDTATSTASLGGIYTSLINSTNVVPYAFNDSEATLTIADITNEFGTIADLTYNDTNITPVSDPVGTGEQFYLGTNLHTVVIYGDVSGNGTVTTYDALLINKIIKGEITPTAAQKLAADVYTESGEAKGTINEKDMLSAVQRFVLKLRAQESGTETILSALPAEYEDLSVTPTGSSTLYRYENNNIATVTTSGSVKLTNEVLKFELVSAPNDAASDVCKYVETSSGVFTLKFTPNVAGEYKIKPYIAGSKVKGGRIDGDILTFNVQEVCTVSEVKLENLGKTLSMGIDTTAEATIVYYHNYTDSEGNLVQYKIPYAQVGNVTIARGTTKHVSNATIENKSKLVVPAYAQNRGLSEDLATAGEEKLTISVSNSNVYQGTTGYQATSSTEITVTVTTKDLNTVNLNEQERVNINIYTYDPGNNLKIVKQLADGRYYTILDIAATDSNGNKVKLYKNDLGSSIKFREVNEEDGMDGEVPWDIVYAGFKKTASGDYELVTNLGSEIDAIGIAFSWDKNDLEGTPEDIEEEYNSYIICLEEGVTLVHKNIVKCEIGVTVKTQDHQ